MFKFAILGTVCSLLLSSVVQAKEQRWFEVEMIVFSQTPAANSQEKFDFPVTPIRPGRSIDLVTPLYQPDISPLLEIIPLCTTPATQPDEQDLLAVKPAYYYQLVNLCVFEPQNKPWLLHSFMQTRYYDSQLPMPRRISALMASNGKHTNQPYIVAAEALQLTDIATRIQNQTDKSLLLHTAWRQVPVTQRRAIASHWYAGENFSDKFDYWGQPKRLSEQHNTDSLLLQDGIKTAPNFQLNANDANDANAIDPNITDLSQADIITNIEQLLAQLSANSQLPTPKRAIETNDNSSQPVAAKLGSKVPDYTWQLDGLFKLHLDHYLFVNAEFNLRLPSEDSLQTIYVKQSRRVISGEIHYLDHPYLGIILQIRRFEPAQLDNEIEPEIDLILN
ncbi:CsiV family protein [Rheinheimera sp. MMS21-TC3]|uniref:CsiV family protein n=1 Tax=Rheinheimera sp. MMS21-TC3 TaxID=3072790 RepID=UPI0028C4F1A2|nr:CsiV family protein [Rheinheimera sp. MMS21-TC3]WNO61206.1 CsiV family protein [Rheinheimera sp. MMS21-TC3]